MEKYYPEIGVGILFVIFIIIIPFFIKRSRSTKKQDLPSFMCEWATKHNVPKRADTVESFFVQNFDDIKCFYVLKTREPLIIQNVPKLFQEAIRQYLK